MRIFLAGVSCVGKSAVGIRLAEAMDYHFCDMDIEMEKYYSKPIKRLYDACSRPTFLSKMAVVLEKALMRADDIVVALPPCGLMGAMWKMVNWLDDSVIIVLRDTPENILKRIRFYDDDSYPIERILNDEETDFYLNEIRDDIACFKKSLAKGDIDVDISDCDVGAAVMKVSRALKSYYLRAA